MSQLIQQLSEISGLGSEILWLSLLVFMRVGAAMSLLPAFGEQSIPQRVRLVLAFAFTAVVMPAISATKQPVDMGITPLLIETGVGLLLGIGLRLFVLALQTAGAIAAQATTLSQMFGDAGPEPQPALSNLLVMGGLALAVSSGLHLRLASFLILSYQVLPLGQLPGAAEQAQWGVALIAKMFAMAFVLAAPFTIAAFLYNVALGVINRAMPALMVTFIGAPALTAGGLALMAIAVPMALAIWLQSFESFLSIPFPAQP